MLKIAKNLSLPVDFVTERIAFLARTGAGKSGGARVIFEQALASNIFTVYVDPKGDAWGIRAAGIKAGKPVLIMGGDHGDVPLDPGAGKFTAEFLNRERVSCVLDISDFQTKEMWRFMADFGMRFYQKNREVVLVILDEADMIAGEKFYDPKTLHAIQLIQNKGRHRGFGVIVVSQRSAILNKSVLYACGTLVAMQTTAPKDIKVVQDYFDVSGEKDAAKEIVSNLPTLQNREAFVYSPHILGAKPIRITFDTFQTFDSMRTPKPGEARQQPKSIADIDLSAVQKDMAATIEKVNAEDPKILQARVRELERELQQRPVEKAEPVIQTVEVFPEHARATIAERLDAIENLIPIVEDAGRTILNKCDHYRSHVDDIRRVLAVQPKPKAQAAAASQGSYSFKVERAPASNPPPLRVSTASNGSGSLPEGEKKCLIAIAQNPSGATREQVSLLSGYKRSTRDAYIQRLEGKGYVYKDSSMVYATNEGIEALGTDYEPLPTGRELQAWWLDRLPDGEAKVLRVLIDHYPHTVDRETISQQTDYKRSTRDAYIQRLGVRKLITVVSGGIKASDNLF